MILTAVLAAVGVFVFLAALFVLAVLAFVPEWVDRSPAAHRLEDRRVPEVTS